MAAVEFAMLAPVFFLILAGTIDLSGVVYTKFSLNAAATAATQYALINAANVNASSGPELAESLGKILKGNSSFTSTGGTVTVNNGSSATLANGSVTTGGTASNADSCYCPSGSRSSFAYGAKVACGAACSADLNAGKYVQVLVSRPYQSIFSNWGIVANGTISVTAQVRVQ